MTALRLQLYAACLLFVLASAASMANCSKPFKLALEQWPPYVYTTPQGKPAGLDIELLNAIFAEAGCQLVLVAELPRKRRLAEFMAGEIDIMLAASDTPERREYSWFTRAYRPESVSLFSHPAQLAQYREISSFSDLLRRRISLLAPNAGWYGEDYKKHQDALLKAHLVSPFESFTQGIKMFAAKRAELIMGDTGAIVHEARRQGLSISPLPNLVVSAPVHFMLSKKNVTEADLLQLNAALDKLEQRGVLKMIRTHYGM
jgi:polar amino acid transport system substrate-binding protein